jgi:hypothetical protein
MISKSVNQKKVVIILEHPEDIEVYQHEKTDIFGEHVLIATLPEVCWELEKMNMQFTGIENFHDPQTIYSIGMKNYQIVEKICSSIDTIFQEKNPLIKKFDFRPARDNFYYIKILFDSLIIRVQLINSLIQKEKPDEIHIFASKSEFISRGDQNYPFEKEERLYALLLKTGKWGPEVTESQYTTKTSPPKGMKCNRSSLQADISKILKKHPFLFVLALTVRNFGIVETFHVFFPQIAHAFRRNKKMFLVREDPSWSSMIPELYKSGYQISYLPEICKFTIHESPFDGKTIETISTILSPECIFKNVDFSGIVMKRLLTVLTAFVNYLPDIVQTIEQRIITDCPIAFLCSEKSSFIEHIYTHIAQYHKIPVIAWQHGEGPVYPPMQVFVEIMDSDIHLCYGPGYQRMLQQAPHNHFKCRIESAGSLILEKLYMQPRRTHSPARILYVSPAYYYNTLYVNCYALPDNILWYYQKKIIDILANTTIPIDFKLFPDPSGRYCIEDYCRTHHFENISIIRTKKTFLELLGTADIIICDYPGTPIIEAIAAHKTVFVLLDYPYLRDDALGLLKKRVYWSADINEFVRLIHDYLSDLPLDQHPDINNTEYLEAFGLHKLDGKVSQRALDIIERETRLF